MSAGAGCTQIAADTVDCAGVTGITVQPFDGDDRILNATSLPSTLKGGQGSDRLVGGGGDDRMYGDRGVDIFWGGPGGDVLNGDDGPDTCLYDTGDLYFSC
ncbi:hypothetical protein SAMN05444920_1011105 [Nonomuraea solani]|uniref:Hemolysin-type calcium-binding repeat-containing protein n=1 Tax=Nonomuraea solani TaxID=1144553 RepID=A0A1H5W7M3_9ACTN|nr:hypothetical protein [Nonomuraea solani]SEF95492.1 hypothetical protein SAMN05444920_1011105 [Nonomuraea solani]